MINYSCIICYLYFHAGKQEQIVNSAEEFPRFTTCSAFVWSHPTDIYLRQVMWRILTWGWGLRGGMSSRQTAAVFVIKYSSLEMQIKRIQTFISAAVRVSLNAGGQNNWVDTIIIIMSEEWGFEKTSWSSFNQWDWMLSGFSWVPAAELGGSALRCFPAEAHTQGILSTNE